MKILLTGASSYIGSYLTRALSSQGHQVVGTFRRTNSRTNALSALPRVELVQIDLANDSDLLRVPTDFDAVVHNAGSFPWIDVDYSNVVCCNVLGTLNLASWIKRIETVSRIISYSTPRLIADHEHQDSIYRGPPNPSAFFGQDP